jgi:hypothetical protein
MAWMRLSLRFFAMFQAKVAVRKKNVLEIKIDRLAKLPVETGKEK